MSELGLRPIAAPAPRQRSARYRAHRAGLRAEVRRICHGVAERYPWLDAYTPINEPLTTARFCGLYGLLVPARP